MEMRFRGIVAAAVSSAKQQKRIMQVEQMAVRLRAASPLRPSQSQLIEWLVDEANRQGVPSDYLPIHSAPAPALQDADILIISRMARESGGFYEGLAQAITPKLH